MANQEMAWFLKQCNTIFGETAKRLTTSTGTHYVEQCFNGQKFLMSLNLNYHSILLTKDNVIVFGCQFNDEREKLRLETFLLRVKNENFKGEFNNTLGKQIQNEIDGAPIEVKKSTESEVEIEALFPNAGSFKETIKILDKNY